MRQARRKIRVQIPEVLAAAIDAAVERGEYADADSAMADAVTKWQLAQDCPAESVEELRRLWRDGVESGIAGDLDLVMDGIIAETRTPPPA